MNNTPATYQKPGAGGEPVPHHPGPGMNALLNHLLAKYPGSKSLGCYNNRSVRGGHATSLHAVSRAIDWKYPSHAVRDEVWKAITEQGMGHALGIQATHDYNTRLHGGSKWGRHSAPARTWGHNAGVHWAHVGPGDTWLHIELDRDASVDPNLMSRVGIATADHSHPVTHHEPEHHQHAAHPFTHGHLVPRHTLRVGSRRSNNCRNLQAQLRAWHHANPSVPDPGNADGRFGNQTARSLKGMQKNVLHILADGVYGVQTEAAWRRLHDEMVG
jgi:hypothetical protein